jgi:hypothetical protein
MIAAAFACLPTQSSHTFDEALAQHLDQLVDWLGLDAALTRHNSTTFARMHKRSYPAASLPSSLLQELALFYQPHHERVFALLSQNWYGQLVQQLQNAWKLELAETFFRLLQQRAPAAPGTAIPYMRRQQQQAMHAFG